jgi:hypothetical protein
MVHRVLHWQDGMNLAKFSTETQSDVITNNLETYIWKITASANLIQTKSIQVMCILEYIIET